MKKFLKDKPKGIFLIVGGIVVTLLSFLFEYALKFNRLYATIIIFVIDFALFFVNLFYFSTTAKLSKTIFNVIICTLVYFIGFPLVFTILLEGNLKLFLIILKIFIFLAPSIVTILPILKFLIEYL